MKLAKFLLPLLLCAIIFGFTPDKKTGPWKDLFNGKDFTGWDTYLGPDLDNSGKPVSTEPVGLNHDPKQVFSVIAENGENIIRVSGESWGALSTKKEFENYHLQLKFKWGALSWGQKKGKKKDSGLLYHSVGQYGADYGAWMRSQEFQIEEGNCGEYWGVAGGTADIPVVKKPDMAAYIYSPQGTPATFSQGSKQGRHCMKGTDAENSSGQWNTLDLYCHGDTSIHVVNGKVIMVLYRNRQVDKGQESPLTKGKIQLQSEGAEIFFKGIKIQAIDKLPAELIK
jgi:hypothetical protein